MRYLNPIIAPIMKQVFKGWLKKYKTILEARAAEATSRQAVAAQPRA